MSRNENTTEYQQFHLQIPSATSQPLLTQPGFQPGLKQKQLTCSYSHRYQTCPVPWPHALVQKVWKIPAFLFP